MLIFSCTNSGSGITTQITNDENNDVRPEIHGDSVSWSGTRNHIYQIFLYQISSGELIQVTNTTSDNFSAVIDGKLITWYGFSDGDSEIYIAEIDGLLFEGGFENGDFSEWTRVNDGGGFLTVCPEAALSGSYGACIDRGTNDKRKQLIDETPVDQTSYLVRFNIDLNGLSMSEGERFRFAQVKMGAERPFVVVLRYLGGQNEIMLKTLLDDLSKPSTGWYPLTAGTAYHRSQLGGSRRSRQQRWLHRSIH